MAGEVQASRVALNSESDARVKVIQRRLRVDVAVPKSAGVLDETHHQLALGMHINLAVVDCLGKEGVDPMSLLVRCSRFWFCPLIGLLRFH